MTGHSRIRIHSALLGAGLVIAGCSPASITPPVATESPASTPARSPSATAATIDLTGRWTGVEGMFLDVQRGPAPGAYRLTMQYDLDNRGGFDAVRDGATLTFRRDGKRVVLKPTDGDATGLKYLAGKEDCLTVAPGEGYCRD